ncbi:MAG: hypothetical protein ACI8SR_003103 [Oceanicoccus sp.]|jgi:hypothetical protein
MDVAKYLNSFKIQRFCQLGSFFGEVSPTPLRSYFTPLASHILTRHFGCSGVQKSHFVIVTDLIPVGFGVMLLWEGACTRQGFSG